MAADYILEGQEQDIAERNYHNIIYEAAHYVVNEKMSRTDAFSHSQTLHEERQDQKNYVITNEETMEIEYSEIRFEKPKFEETKQIKAVAKDMYEEFELEK